MSKHKIFLYKPSFKDNFLILLFALSVFCFMHWISYNKTGQLIFQPIICFISLALLLIPLISSLKHRKYIIILNESEIIGFDTYAKRRVLKKIEDLKSFEVIKASSRLDPKNHLAQVDHIAIDFSSGERFVIYLKPVFFEKLLKELKSIK